MTDTRVVEPAVLEAALASRAPALRASAALAIGQVHATALAPVLRGLLGERDTAVAANAAYALGLLRDSLSVPSLATALRAATPVAVEAAWALGQIGAPARRTIEQSLAGSVPRDRRVTGALLIAASKLRPPAVAVTLAYLHDPDPEIRWRAAYVTARPFAPAGVRALLTLTADSAAIVRSQVARALSRQAAGDSLRPHALAALDTLARDPHPHVRINALRSLGTYGAVAREPLVAATRDRDANVRIAAAQSLGDALDAAPEPWVALWNADTTLVYRRAILASAAQAGAPLPALTPDAPDAWMHARDWRVRAAAVEAAAASRADDRSWRVLVALAADVDPRVRAAALDAIGAIADSTRADSTARLPLLGALTDSDAVVRASALGALATRASAVELPRVLASYRLAVADSVADARLAALRYIVAAWRRDSTAFPDSLRDELASLAVPRQALERSAAGGIAPLAAWSRVRSEPPHALDWYEARVRELVVPALGGRLPRAELRTARGTITLELFAHDAPLTVTNFMSLARSGYYTDVRFHRVVPNFVAQDGDRRGDGNGGPPYTIRDELNRRRYVRGMVGMALSGPDTGGSQYFLTLSPQPHLDGGYTVFARVVNGLDVMDALVQGDRIADIVVK
jgi:cyclophilin family peptidyl-prolyl cis-trans isomerase/HEAT repeat protein